MSEEEKEQKEQQEKEQQEKWDKEKQRADQAEANYRKLSVERDEILGQLAERDDKLAKLETRMEELAKQHEVPVEDLLDPDVVDAKTIKTVGKMAKQIRDQQKDIEKLTKLAKDFEDKSKKQQAKSDKEQLIERILKPLDKEFGAKYRNSARKLADSLVDEGKESQPKDVIEAMDLMRRCYKQMVTEAEEKEKKEKLQTDTGSSSVSAFDKELPKSGSRREILTEMKKKGLSLFGKTAQQ